MNYKADANLIKQRMTKREVCEAFNATKIDIPELVKQNLLIDKGIYYAPTTKLYYNIFLPKTITINKDKRTLLINNEVFTKEELIELFDSNCHVVTWLKMNGYVYQSSDCRYRKADKLCEILAEGEEDINTTE